MNFNNFTRYFGKSMLMLSMLLTFALSASAQQVRTAQQMEALQKAEFSPAASTIKQIGGADLLLLDPSTARTDDPVTTMGIDAMWDVEFTYSVSDSAVPAAPLAGLAGAYWTGTEFWVSAWATDTLIRLNPDGSLIEVFTIAGVSNVRSITGDGTNLYAGSAGASIAVIDPTTRTLTSTIGITGAAASIGARFLTYDATLDGGNGGFYIGNFTSDIGVVALTGATLTTIGTATHGRVGMYGAVTDNISAGGPYLWVFEQPGTPSDGVISQLALPAGTFTGVQREVNADIGGTAGLAGGLFIATNHPAFPTQNIIGGLLQNGPDLLFGYDLDFSPIQVDANVTNFTGNGLVRMPQDHVSPSSFSTDILNQGAQALTSATLTVSVDSGGMNVFSEAQTFTNVIQGATAGFTTAAFTAPNVPGTVYEATSVITLAGQTDENTINDTTGFAFLITDSTFARDNNVINVQLGLGAANAGGGQTTMGQNYTVGASGGTVTSVDFFVNAPTAGDSTWGVLWATDPATGSPTSQISRTPTYVFTAADAANGVFLTLPYSTQLPLPPSTTFFTGAVEAAGNASLNLGVSNGIFTPGAVWIKSDSLGGGAWFASENFWVGGEWAHIIRPNLSYCTSLDALAGGLQDNGDGSGSAFVLASGGTPPYTYSWSNGATTDTALFLAAGFYSVTVSDARGCLVTQDSVEVIDNTAIEDDLAGINEIKTFPNPSTGRFTVDIELAEMDDIRLEVMDIAGRTIYMDAANRVQMYNEQIDLSNQSQGVYILRVHTTKGSTYRRLVIE